MNMTTLKEQIANDIKQFYFTEGTPVERAKAINGLLDAIDKLEKAASKPSKKEATAEELLEVYNQQKTKADEAWQSYTDAVKQGR